MRLRHLTVLLRAPRRALLRQIRVVGEAPPGDEVRLHEFDQVLDAPFLLGRVRITELGVEAELGGETGKRRVPSRLAVHRPAERHRLHVVVDARPRDAPELLEDRELPPEQPLEHHRRAPPDRHGAAVLEPRREKHAPHDRAPERDVRLAPVHLEKLPGQALEPDHRRRGRCPRLLVAMHVPVPGRRASRVGRRRIGADQLEHPLDREAGVQPRRHGPVPRGESTRPRSPLVGMVDRLAHHARDRPPLTPDLGRDRDVGQPPLLQVLDCTAGHGSQHPPLPPASQRPPPPPSEPAEGMLWTPPPPPPHATQVPKLDAPPSVPSVGDVPPTPGVPPAPTVTGSVALTLLAESMISFTAPPPPPVPP